MKRLTVAIAVLLALSACGGSSDPAPSKSSATATTPTSTSTSSTTPAPTKAASQAETYKPADIYDLMSFVVATGLKCPGEWREADNESVMGLLGADSVARCGTFYDDPNKSDDEYIVIAIYSDKRAMQPLLQGLETKSPDHAEAMPVYAGDTWLVQASDARKLEKVAAGRLVTPAF